MATRRRTCGARHFLVAGLLGTLALSVNSASAETSSLRSRSGGNAARASVAGVDHLPDVAQRPPQPQTSAQSGSRASGPKTVARRPGETAEQLAARVVPAGGDTITKPLEFELPPLGKVILVLYQVGSDDPTLVSDPSVYRGIVLVPEQKTGLYRMEPLPSQKEGAATLMYDVKSVFLANAGGDGAPDLCILSEISEAGESAKPHMDTDLFRWSGSAFTLVDQGDRRPLYNLRNARAVRARLKQMRGL